MLLDPAVIEAPGQGAFACQSKPTAAEAMSTLPAPHPRATAPEQVPINTFEFICCHRQKFLQFHAYYHAKHYAYNHPKHRATRH